MSATETEPYQGFLEWRAAVDAAAALRAQIVGRRIKMSSLYRSDVDGATGVVKDVTAQGFKVRWNHSAQVDYAHPDDVMFI